MLFQTIDYKNTCYGFYANGNVMIDQKPDVPESTWDYSHLCDHNTKLAKIYCGGNNFLDVCPDELKEEAEQSFEKIKSFMRSIINAKIDLDHNCLYDFIPTSYLQEHFEIRNKITDFVLSNFEQPENYNYLRNASELIYNIHQKELKINLETIKKKLPNPKASRFLKTQHSNKIKYNLFGAVTGRLTLDRSSFPVLNIDKSLRDCIEPNNHRFVELDYNSAELRVMLALSDIEQPNIDLHDWNIENIFDHKYDRAQAKQKIFSWLYDNKTNNLAEKVYDKNLVIDKYWDGSEVKTPYNRAISCDKNHALNYILQSTASDMVLEQAYKIHELLKGRKSYIAFYLYDSVIVDFHQDDVHLLREIKDIFAETRFGRFLTNVSIGKNFGEMRKIK